MPGITFNVAGVDPELVSKYADNIVASTALDVIKYIWKPNPDDTTCSSERRCKEVLQSSLGRGNEAPANIIVKENGFVHTVIDAYNHHHNLVIRPDDIWIAILTQINLYVSAHAEELRQKLVQHEEKKTLITVTYANRQTRDFSDMAQSMAKLLKENITDPTIYDAIMLNFSTTNANDVAIRAAIMMSTMKSYFDYIDCLLCGIPTITLEGTKADYQSILINLEKLVKILDGKEPLAFYALLKPVIKQFMAAFDAIENGKPVDTSFWSRICHVSFNGSGSDTLSGWLGSFAVWTDRGEWQGTPLDKIKVPPGKRGHGESDDLGLYMARNDRLDSGFGNEPLPPLTFDGIMYPLLDLDSIPRGFGEVPVLLLDNGKKVRCSMIAGHVGALAVADAQGSLNTVRPSPQWFMLELSGEEATEAE